MTQDVLVIGAGVAGLACARALADRGVRVRVLEARDRVGGRICTVHDDALPVAVELGAELVHGAAEETVALANAHGLPIVDVAERRVSMHEGTVRKLPDFWERIDVVMRRLPRSRPSSSARSARDGATNDRPFAAFLAERPGGHRFARERALAQQFVESFHAVDVDSVSERAMAAGGSPRGDEDERRTGRIPSGYAQVPHALVADARATGGAGALDVVTGAVVRRIEHARGRVVVHVANGKRTRTERARAVVVAVPLGVLQSSAFALETPARVTRAIGLLGMGRVRRVVLAFEHAFWLDGAHANVLHDATFMHTGDARFAVMWTTSPVRAPAIVAWSAGPHADAMATWSDEEVAQAALAAFAQHLGVRPSKARAMLSRAHTHDWQRDPFALGAYSYARVGGAEASKVLARSIDGTVFFAGEHTSEEGRSGTVDGALSTGARAARQVLRALSGSRARRG